MKKLFYIVISTIFIFSIISLTSCQKEFDFDKKLLKVISNYRQLKPGMKRAEVLKNFTIQGGIYTRTHVTYTHKSSPYIKIDLVFKASDENKNDFENPNDIIVELSKLYLDYAVID